jgi:glutaredoxin-like protein NrdH
LITVYSKPDCKGCDLTKGRFVREGVPFQELSVLEHRDALLAMGYSSAPVVVVDDQDHWAGFRPDRIQAVTERYGRSVA